MTRELIITIDATAPRADIVDALRFYATHIAEPDTNTTRDLNTYDGHTIGHATTREQSYTITLRPGPTRSAYAQPVTSAPYPTVTTAWQAAAETSRRASELDPRDPDPDLSEVAQRTTPGTWTDRDGDTWTVNPTTY